MPTKLREYFQHDWPEHLKIVGPIVTTTVNLDGSWEMRELHVVNCPCPKCVKVDDDKTG
jgi:hypothetical protein